MAKKGNEISVEEKLRALYDLQIIDSRLDEIRNTRGELPIEVEDLENEIKGLEKRAERFREDIKTNKEGIQNFNTSIKESKSMIDKYKVQKENIRNNKEFEALEKEIEYQELEIQLSEKRIKELNAKNEHINENLSDLEEKISGLKEHLNFKKNELDDLIAETQNEEDYLVKKSEEFSEKIDERLLNSYNRIRSNSNNGLAVVGIERGAPKGSFFMIPPQKQVEIAQRKKIIIDEHSGKILVDDQLVLEETEKMKEILNY